MTSIPVAEQQYLYQLAAQVGAALQKHNLYLTTAESCTGGYVAEIITTVPGCSKWFERAFVTYSNKAKQDMLGVREETLQQYGAVSEQTVREMAEGALQCSDSQVSIAISGIAGPDGGTEDKPLGFVWFGWAKEHYPTVVEAKQFAGDRQRVRYEAVKFALIELLTLLQDQDPHPREGE